MTRLPQEIYTAMRRRDDKAPGRPTPRRDSFGALTPLATDVGTISLYRLGRLAELGIADVDRLPFSVKVLLENLLRHCDGYLVTEDDVVALARWRPKAPEPRALSFLPARVLLQDLTGVPAIADLAAMRSAVRRLGRDSKRINPIVPVDLVVDHSVHVDYFGSDYAFAANVEREFERNGERFAFLRWAQRAFQSLRVVPPGAGIVHQVNLEYLASVVRTRSEDGAVVAFPDTVVGTDSHTTMINSLGVLGWGVGGIEAEAVMLGQPLSILTPEVVGVRLVGQLREGVTATDLVLTVTQMLRRRGVVDKFVEFHGPGLAGLSLPDRATIANMAPEYGATVGFFAVDAETLRYLRATGRDAAQVRLVEDYARAQGLLRAEETPDPVYGDALELDLGSVEPSLAGPRRPQDRVTLRDLKATFQHVLPSFRPAGPTPPTEGLQTARDASARRQARYHVLWSASREPDAGPSVRLGGETVHLADGAVVIAAITSCTNTSNPSLLIAAGLLARNAVRRGLSVKPYVKTSLAPGSPVVVDYLQRAGLLPYLEALRFHPVGLGCTTCIGNSGTLPEPVARVIRENDLVVAAVLSGNRNFEGRINPDCRMNFLASPPLVVAYALAGTVDVDLSSEPLGQDPNALPVYLRDIWPTAAEVDETAAVALDPADFVRRYEKVSEGNERWQKLTAPEGDLYEWQAESTYIQEPPFFESLTDEPGPIQDIQRARVLAVLGDSVTTDHISPAGSIPAKSPAGRYLIDRGVRPADFNSYGARRGNHEVMVRGTFANIRLRNLLVTDAEGGVTVHLPSGEQLPIYEAAMRYRAEGVPLLVVAGKEYGSGSSRDWAAKGPLLLGVRAVLAESYERIHRSNLVGMGILPLEFLPGQSLSTFGLTGREEYSIEGIAEGLTPRKRVTVRARRDDGTEAAFAAIARLDSPIEIDYYRHGGILQYVLRQLA